MVGLDSGDNGLPFVGADALAVVFAVFPALQQEVGALGDGLAAALDCIGLLTDMAADQVVDGGHFFEDAGAFLLEGW